MTDIPRIIEGADPFDEQASAREYLAALGETPFPSKEKQVIVKRIYQKFRNLVGDNMTPSEIQEEFVYKFGVKLEDMNGVGLMQAEHWVSQIVVKPVGGE